MFVSITNLEYRELIRKAAIYDIKKRELESAGYVTDSDRNLFDIPKHKEEPIKPQDDDF